MIPNCDTLHLVVIRCPTVVVDPLSYEESEIVLDETGLFEIKLDTVLKPFYFSVSPIVNGKMRRIITRADRLLGMPGDSVHFEIHPDTVIASGKGADRHMIHFQYDRLSYFSDKPQPGRYAEDMDTLVFHQIESHYDSVYREKKKILDAHRNALTAEAYELMATDLMTGRSKLDLTTITTALTLSPVRVYREYLSNLFWREYADIDLTDWQQKVYASYYADQIFNRILLSEQLGEPGNVDKRPVPVQVLFDRIYDGYEGILREKLLLGLLCRYRTNENLDEYIDSMATVFDTPDLYRSLTKYRETAEQTQREKQVSFFSFTDDKGRAVDSTALLGQVTLVDLWYTGCAACANALARLSPLLTEKISQNKLQMISISIDDKPKWLKSLKTGIYTHPLGIHVYTNDLKSTHPFIKNYLINSYPAFFLIDKKGRIIKRTQSAQEIEGLISAL